MRERFDRRKSYCVRRVAGWISMWAWNWREHVWWLRIQQHWHVAEMRSKEQDCLLFKGSPNSIDWQVSLRPSIIALKALSKAYIRRQSEKVPIWFPVLWLRTPCDSTADNGKSPIQRINHHFISPGTSSAQNKFLSCLLLISLFSCVHIIRGRLIDGVSKRANNTYTQWLRWVT